MQITIEIIGTSAVHRHSKKKVILDLLGLEGENRDLEQEVTDSRGVMWLPAQFCLRCNYFFWSLIGTTWVHPSLNGEGFQEFMQKISS